MGVIVGGIGLTGTAQVFDYLQQRMAAHDVEHNKEIADVILSKLDSSSDNHASAVTGVLLHAIADYRPFGYRLFVLDGKNRTLIIDSGAPLTSPQPIGESWLASATDLRGAKVSLLETTEAVRALGKDRHPMLICLQEMQKPGPDGWILGIGKDQKTLIDFLGDLRWNLESVLLLTYLLIALLGYYSMRSVGRIYERRLETRLRERTQELNAAHQEVLHKTRLATIGQTASVLTHEMRNPLASIKLALSNLKSLAVLGARETRRIELVLGEVDRLEALLSKTLNYVRPVNLSDTPVNIAALLAEVIKQQQPLLEEKHLTIRQQDCSDSSETHVDQAQMYQVLLNLIKNAIEASPTGAEITTLLRREAGRLILEITNAGEAPGEQVLRKAFEPFFTTKPKGTGLGLGLVKRVVEEHGGRVTLTGNNGTGARLTLSLPLDHASIAALTSNHHAAEAG